MEKKFALSMVLVLTLKATGFSQNPPQSASDRFIDRQLSVIETHKKLLVQSGHMANDYGMPELVLGTYSWHGAGGGYFGAYSFSQVAFDQAKKAWFGHFEVLEGSNQLWAEDENIRFDDSMVGWNAPSLSMNWFEGDDMKMAVFQGGKIIKIKDDGRTAVIEIRAPHHAEQWNTMIVPADWNELCNCTNNFGPPFVDGQPVVDK